MAAGEASPEISVSRSSIPLNYTNKQSCAAIVNNAIYFETRQHIQDLRCILRRDLPIRGMIATDSFRPNFMLPMTTIWNFFPVGKAQAGPQLWSALQFANWAESTSAV